MLPETTMQRLIPCAALAFLLAAPFSAHGADYTIQIINSAEPAEQFMIYQKPSSSPLPGVPLQWGTYKSLNSVDVWKQGDYGLEPVCTVTAQEGSTIVIDRGPGSQIIFNDAPATCTTR